MALGVGDIIRTAVNFRLPSGDQYQNVYHHIWDGIGGVSDAAVVLEMKDWAETMYAAIDDHVNDGTVEQLSFVDQVEWVVDQWEVVANIGTFTPAFVPTDAGFTCPNQVSPFVVFKTSRPKSVGRKFLFPVPTAKQDAGIMLAPTIAAIVAYADVAVNDIAVDVVNDLHPGIIRVGVNQFLSFQVAIVTDLTGSQRRRRPGDGA